MQQRAKGIRVPVQPDSVLDPTIYYDNELTGIYFVTKDDRYGRVTFSNLDALRVCRGEYLPYPDDWDWQSGVPYCWVTIVEHSAWLRERHAYEAQHYRSAYEFGGNVDEMLTDFCHYIFSFHDRFVEAIARGVWFEESAQSLFGQPLSIDHPQRPLPKNKTARIDAAGLTSFVRINPLDVERLMDNAQYHPQKLLEFRIDDEDANCADHRLSVERHNGRIVSRFSGYFGNAVVTFDDIADLADVRPYIERYLAEVAERRRKM